MLIKFTTDKKLRVEVVSGFSEIEIENHINRFLYKRTDVEVQDIKLNHQVFKDGDDLKCYYVALIKYLK